MSLTFTVKANPEKTPSMPSAAARVLALPELLSSILADLAFKDLIRATHVCRQWNDMIKSERKLKETLFIDAAPITRIIDPAQDSRQSGEDGERAAVDYDPVVRVNPLLKVILPNYDPENGDPYLVLIELQWKFRRPQKLARDPTGMWRDMFITQPPCKEIKPRKTALQGFDLEMLSELGLMVPDDHDVIRDEGGVRLGTVIDEFKACGWGHPGGYIFGYVNERSRVLDSQLAGSKSVAVRDGKIVRE